jgi:hypothetical protein
MPGVNGFAAAHRLEEVQDLRASWDVMVCHYLTHSIG